MLHFFKKFCFEYHFFASFRAYAAWCDNTDIDSTLETEYSAKLVIANQVLPDPMSLKEGWLKEKDKNDDGHL